MGTLEAIVGHDQAVAFLRQALQAGRLPHAWLFVGPQGVGKRTLALAFAGRLLTPASEPERGEALGLLEAGAHPDLTVISKELAAYSEDAATRARKQRTIPIELLREFFDPAVARTASLPGGLASKVCIIDQAHLLAREGQNHLLKTLEEPPPGTVIILVADRPHDLLPTIHSRCQSLRLAPLSDEAMDRWLASHASLDQAQRRALVRQAEGSPGRADLLLRTGAVHWPEQLEPLAEACLAGRDDGALAEACAGLADQWAKDWVKAHPAASKDAANRSAHELVLAVLGRWARDRLAEGVVGPEAVEAITACAGLLARDVQPRFAYEVFAERLAEAGRHATRAPLARGS